ncbi:hypothetical protein FGO68_gene7383 [Halteria grandinella]|uniref:Uncharacterized protein n=1 Tax=Halteria grandinella TaxID=5974 RepID=A0A8J8P9V5_HALGN|nr:hypothetical protein FGO68_gene7383 [Halteria grandinella]
MKTSSCFSILLIPLVIHLTLCQTSTEPTYSSLFGQYTTCESLGDITLDNSMCQCKLWKFQEFNVACRALYPGCR